SSKPLTARTPIDTSREAVYHIPAYGSNIRKLVHDDKLQAQERQQAITTPQERIVAAKQVKAMGSDLAKARNAVKASPNDAALRNQVTQLERAQEIAKVHAAPPKPGHYFVANQHVLDE